MSIHLVVPSGAYQYARRDCSHQAIFHSGAAAAAAAASAGRCWTGPAQSATPPSIGAPAPGRAVSPTISAAGNVSGARAAAACPSWCALRPISMAMSICCVRSRGVWAASGRAAGCGWAKGSASGASRLAQLVAASASASHAPAAGSADAAGSSSADDGVHSGAAGSHAAAAGCSASGLGAASPSIKPGAASAPKPPAAWAFSLSRLPRSMPSCVECAASLRNWQMASRRRLSTAPSSRPPPRGT